MFTAVTVNQGCWSTAGSLVGRHLSIKTEGKRLESRGREKPGTWRVCCIAKDGGKGEKPRQFVFNILLVLDTMKASDIGF